MLQVTDKAAEMVKEFFKARDKVEALRIFVSGVG
jgi:Fe-S cluster assembly iron-binding protein IscA